MSSLILTAGFLCTCRLGFSALKAYKFANAAIYQTINTMPGEVPLSIDHASSDMNTPNAAIRFRNGSAISVICSHEVINDYLHSTRDIVSKNMLSIINDQYYLGNQDAWTRFRAHWNMNISRFDRKICYMIILLAIITLIRNNRDPRVTRHGEKK